MEKSRFLPDAERLSVLIAAVVLAYALTRLVAIPARLISFDLAGIYIELPVNVTNIVTLLVGGLTAAGADWLLRDHPALQGRSIIQHAILPALTAWILGIPLAQLQSTFQWWIALAFGSSLITSIVIAEYIAIDARDFRYPLAASGLTAAGFALFFILAVAVRTGELRLFLVLPALTIAGGLVALRTLHLRLPDVWAWLEAGVVALILGQLSAALHYWPLSPIPYGLILVGVAYALSSLIANLVEEKPLKQALLEPGIALLASGGAALWLR